MPRSRSLSVCEAFWTESSSTLLLQLSDRVGDVLLARRIVAAQRGGTALGVALPRLLVVVHRGEAALLHVGTMLGPAADVGAIAGAQVHVARIVGVHQHRGQQP